MNRIVRPTCRDGSLLPFFLVNVPFTSVIHFFFLCDQKEKDDKKKEVAAQNGLSLTAFTDDGAANSLRSDAA